MLTETSSFLILNERVYRWLLCVMDGIFT